MMGVGWFLLLIGVLIVGGVFARLYFVSPMPLPGNDLALRWVLLGGMTAFGIGLVTVLLAWLF